MSGFLVVTGESTHPSGTAIAYETRTAMRRSAGQCPWAPLSASGATKAKARYLQYRANLETTVATPRRGSTRSTSRSPSMTRFEGHDQRRRSIRRDGEGVWASTMPRRRPRALDGAAFAACTSPAEYSGLAHGSHTIVVQATDAHGNVGPATRDVRGGHACAGRLHRSGHGQRRQRDGRVQPDDASAAIKCKLDGAVLAGCTNPAVFKNLASGAHTVVVHDAMQSGNVSSATRTFSVAPGAGNPYTPSGGDPADATAPKVRGQPDGPAPSGASPRSRSRARRRKCDAG